MCLSTYIQPYISDGCISMDTSIWYYHIEWPVSLSLSLTLSTTEWSRQRSVMWWFKISTESSSKHHQAWQVNVVLAFTFLYLFFFCLAFCSPHNHTGWMRWSYKLNMPSWLDYNDILYCKTLTNCAIIAGIGSLAVFQIADNSYPSVGWAGVRAHLTVTKL